MTGASFPPLILASASPSRAALLHSAGLVFSRQPSRLDETAEKRAHASLPPPALCLHLARAKAQAVSARQPDAAVVAADQILALDGKGYSKPVDLAAARERLLILRGRRHTLYNGLAVVRGGEILAEQQTQAELVMRQFSAGWLDWYLAQEGEAVLASAGAYRLEGRGIGLFSSLKGDYFTILGLNLLALLDILRRHKIIPQ